MVLLRINVRFQCESVDSGLGFGSFGCGCLHRHFPE